MACALIANYKQLKFTIMEVIIPILNHDTKRMIMADGFHTTDVMCIYNTETDAVKQIDAADLTQYSGNIVDELKRRGVDSIITSQMSFMAYGLFVDGGFIIYESEGDDVYQNIELFKKRELRLFTPQAAFRNSCSASCGDCSSTCKN
jgi:predicted Fe-Mo cluster-binding NifX family protein